MYALTFRIMLIVLNQMEGVRAMVAMLTIAVETKSADTLLRQLDAEDLHCCTER
jgi:hypothetical protein